MIRPKLVVMGQGRHGKDTVCEFLRDVHGFNFVSSSRFVLNKAIWPIVQHRYPDTEAAYADRHNHRALWYNLISGYNAGDLAKLGRELFQEFDIYCGIRNCYEYAAMSNEGLFDYSIWIDASKRLPPEAEDSCTVTAEMADIMLDNNGPLSAIPDAVNEVLYRIGFPHAY